jgi:membrane associated rhomboid family serine protease/Flp pilus assembly protein TadD
LIAVNVLVFVLMALQEPSSLKQPSNALLLRWGADFGPLTLSGQVWRMVTSSFVHIGLLHVAVNMWSLWVVGRLAERFVGASSAIAIYFLTGIGAAMASLTFHPLIVSAGASGPIFGYVGTLMGIVFFAKSRMDPTQRKNLLSWAVKIAVINLFIGLSAGIDNMAHLGGLVTGAIIGAALVLSTKLQTQNRAVVRLNIFVAAFLVLAFLFVPLRAAKHDELSIYSAYVALNKKDTKTALAILTPYVQRHPSESDAHTALGYALHEAKRDDEAAKEYEQALQLNPNDHVASVNLGTLYVAHGRAHDALPLFKAHFDQVQPDAEDYRAYGEALVQTGDPVTAEGILRRAVTLDASDARAHADLALALKMQNRPTESEAELKIANELLLKQSSEPQVKP